MAAQGKVVAPRELIGYLIDEIRVEEPAELQILSRRQREILELVAEGLSNREIAERLFVTESTVKQHLRAAYKLLGVSNRAEATELVRLAKGGNAS
jgi:DNA-binding NarL/FixJ family response regulator